MKLLLALDCCGIRGGVALSRHKGDNGKQLHGTDPDGAIAASSDGLSMSVQAFLAADRGPR